jgi:hypothetical protein
VGSQSLWIAEFLRVQGDVISWIYILVKKGTLECPYLLRIDRFYALLKNFSPITGEGLQNLGLCWALMAFEQQGIFIVLHLL